MQKTFVLFFLIILFSCQAPLKRQPAAETSSLLNNQLLVKLYSLDRQLISLNKAEAKLNETISRSNNNENTQNQQALFDLEKIQNQIKNIKNAKQDLQNSIATTFLQTGTELPYSHPTDFSENWRLQKEKMVIINPVNYLLKDGQIVHEFTMGMKDTFEYQLGIVDNNQNYTATLTCNAPFEYKNSVFFKKVGTNQKANFKLVAKKGRVPQVILKMHQDISECQMFFTSLDNPENKYGVKLVSDNLSQNKISELRSKVDNCFLPDTTNLVGIEKFFLTNDYQSMTCGMELNNDELTTLEDPLTGMQSKAQALLGMPIPDSMLKAQNPFLELDFKNAPQLNTILISYLVFRSDFYGNLLARLVKWHADRGTQVRILVSDVITLDKDHTMLYGLQESSNNIKIQEYRYDAAGNGTGLIGVFNEFHRTMHVKLLVTLSENAQNNMVFFGGRNIHDGFVFKDIPDYTNYPQMDQYGTGKGKDESYAFWRDFEVKIKSKELAEKIATHYLTLWDRDSKHFDVRSINQNINVPKLINNEYFKNANHALIRHIISVPFKDDEMLEKFYINMFDSAEKSLRLSTPYFHLTKNIGLALERAVARGVEVSVITRIDLHGDTSDVILSEVNKGTINKFLHKIKIFEYTVPNEILHSKLVLIDDKFSFIGSVNLNKRSFVHDMENGIMIYSKDYNQKMNKIMDSYQKNARVIDELQKLTLWKEIIVGVFSSDL